MTDSVGGMGDHEIVSLLSAGDPRGLELAYTAYADRIHDYARRMLRSDDAAADVTHDTFLIALAKAEGLRDPDKLRPWLYAIARNECLRVLRASSRTTNLDPEIDLPAEGGETEMSTGLTDHDLRALVHAAAAGLSPKDREVFDLGMRHDLSAPEIAAALGVSDNAAHAMLSRVRSQFEKTLGAYVVARSGRDECPELSSMLATWDGEFDALWRKRIARHVAACELCTEVEKRELRPSALLGVMPLFLAPAALHDRIFGIDLVSSSTAPSTEPRTQPFPPEATAALLERARVLAERAGPFEREGFPGRAAFRRRGGLLALALAALVLLGGVGLLRLLVIDSAAQRAGGEPGATALAPAVEPTIGDTATIFRPPEIGATPSLELAPETPTSVAPTTLPPTSAPPGPTATAPTTNPTTRSPEPPAPGRLDVTPREMTVGPLQEATIRVTAVGGPVDWSATFPGKATLSPSAGSLNAGQSATLTFRAPRTQGTYQIVFQPGGVTITVQVVAPG